MPTTPTSPPQITPAPLDNGLFGEIRHVIEQARRDIHRQINQTMVEVYWQIGRLIVEHEQQGEQRADYGKQQLPLLAARLSKESAKGSMNVTCETCACFIKFSKFGTHCVPNPGTT